MKHILAIVATVLLAPMLVVAGAAAPAAALDQDPILITAPTGGGGQTYSVEYPVGTLVGTEPSGTFITPPDCVDLTTCANIPVRVQYPDGYDRDGEEFFISVEINWDASDISVPLPNRPAGQDSVTAQGNDLDTYFYVTEQDDAGETEYRLIAQSATSSAPEKARWLGGADEYVLVISNYIGVNRGFTVTLKTTPAVFGNPIEDLGSGSGFRAPETPSGGFALPEDTSGFGSFASGPAATAPRAASDRIPQPVFVTNPNGLPVIGADGADTFGAFGGSTAEFEDALDGTAPQLFQPARQVGPPKDVPGGLIAFWLGLVPLLLLGAAGAWFWRRRPTALSFVAPSSLAT